MAQAAELQSHVRFTLSSSIFARKMDSDLDSSSSKKTFLISSLIQRISASLDSS